MRGLDAKMEWAKAQHTNPTQGWHNLCQSFVRQSMGVAAWANSAKNAWYAIPAGHRYVDAFADIPKGAAIYFSLGTYGHVMLARGPKDEAWSNDYIRSGKIDQTPRDIPRWGGPGTYLGWSDWTPFGITPVGKGAWDGQVPGRENVRKGNPGARFRLQARLFDLGCRDNPPDDGPHPAYPHDALRVFQKRRGLNPTGDFTQKTQRALFGVDKP